MHKLLLSVLVVSLGLVACSSSTSTGFADAERDSDNGSEIYQGPPLEGSEFLKCVSTHSQAPALSRITSLDIPPKVDLAAAVSSALNFAKDTGVKPDRQVTTTEFSKDDKEALYLIVNAEGETKGHIKAKRLLGGSWQPTSLRVCNDLLVDPGEQENDPAYPDIENETE